MAPSQGATSRNCTEGWGEALSSVSSIMLRAGMVVHSFDPSTSEEDQEVKGRQETKNTESLSYLSQNGCHPETPTNVGEKVRKRNLCTLLAGM